MTKKKKTLPPRTGRHTSDPIEESKGALKGKPSLTKALLKDRLEEVMRR